MYTSSVRSDALRLPLRRDPSVLQSKSGCQPNGDRAVTRPEQGSMDGSTPTTILPPPDAAL